MASKLLNVLQKIEEGRQNCIVKLRDKSYYVPDNASLDDVSSVIDTLPSGSDNHLLTLQHGTINPAIRPTIPSEIQTFVNTFKEADDIDGYMPVYSALLEDSVETTIFSIIANSNNYSSRASEDEYMCIGSFYSSGTNISYGAADYIVKTSDGTTYTKTKSTTTQDFEHTWGDVSKKYFTVYIKITNLSNFCTYSYGNGIRPGKVSIKALVFNTTLLTYFNSYITSASSLGKTQTIPMHCEYMFVEKLNTQKTTELYDYIKNNNTNASYIYLYVSGLSGFSTNLKQLYINCDMYRIINTNSYSSGTIDYAEVSVPSNHAYKATNYFGGVKLLYGYTNRSTENLFTLNRWCWYSQQVGPHNGFTSTNDEVFGESSDYTTIGISGTYNPYSKVGGSVTLNLPEETTTLGNRALELCGANMHIMDLDQITSIIQADPLNRCGASIVKINSLTSLPYRLYDEGYMRVLEVNGIRALSVQLGQWSPCLLKLEMNNLEELTSASACLPRAPVMKEVYLPKLVRTMNPNMFRTGDDFMCYALTNIIVLGNNFESNLNIQDCKCLYKECILDILNKLKDYSADDSGDEHYIKLSQESCRSLTDSEIAIATNKGWEVRK